MYSRLPGYPPGNLVPSHTNAFLVPGRISLTGTSDSLRFLTFTELSNYCWLQSQAREVEAKCEEIEKFVVKFLSLAREQGDRSHVAANGSGGGSHAWNRGFQSLARMAISPERQARDIV